MYLERLSASGIESSKYYVPNGQFNTYSPSSSIQMPNCTIYCYCRSFSATNAEAPFPVARNGLGFGNAKTWFANSPLPKGYEIKTGSIACFDGNYGHVAFVERKIDDTHALISESQYDDDKSLRNYKYWQKRVVELKVGEATLKGVGALQGFIYLPIDDIRVKRDEGLEQIGIIEEYVNVRTSANGDVVQQGCYLPMGVYDVLASKEVDGYMWYKIQSKHWVREGSWLTHYPKNDEVEELKREIKRLQTKLDEIQKVAQY